MLRAILSYSEIKKKRSKTPIGMNYCISCDKFKTKDLFDKSKKNHNGLSIYCKICRKKFDDALSGKPESRIKKPNFFNSKTRHINNVESVKTPRLTKKVYQDLLKNQNGHCAICKNPEPSNKKFCIDHDHKTGKIRGLLCNFCNTGLGFFKDNPESLSNAVIYLKKNK